MNIIRSKRQRQERRSQEVQYYWYNLLFFFPFSLKRGRKLVKCLVNSFLLTTIERLRRQRTFAGHDTNGWTNDLKILDVEEIIVRLRNRKILMSDRRFDMDNSTLKFSFVFGRFNFVSVFIIYWKKLREEFSSNQHLAHFLTGIISFAQLWPMLKMVW